MVIEKIEQQHYSLMLVHPEAENFVECRSISPMVFTAKVTFFFQLNHVWGRKYEI